MGVGGEKVTIESDYEDAETLNDQMSVLGTVNVNLVPISEAYTKASGAKGEGKKIINNPFIKTLTGDNLEKNFFLADGNSTPVSSLDGANGLAQAVVNPSGGPMKILQSMPYTIDKNGNYKIAWEKVKEVTTWGNKFRELYDKKLVDLHRDKAKGDRLTEAENKLVIGEVEALLGKMNNDPNIKVGDIAMIPILVNAPKSYEDSLENVLSSNLTPTEKAELSKGNWDKNIHKTFAFTVLPNGPLSHLPDAFGPEMAIANEMVVADIMKDYATTARIDADGYDWVSTLVSSAITEPTTDK
jgi:hypothetical protein